VAWSSEDQCVAKSVKRFRRDGRGALQVEMASPVRYKKCCDTAMSVGTSLRNSYALARDRRYPNTKKRHLPPEMPLNPIIYSL
jgi:hypothetical protein